MPKVELDVSELVDVAGAMYEKERELCAKGWHHSDHPNNYIYRRVSSLALRLHYQMQAEINPDPSPLFEDCRDE